MNIYLLTYIISSFSLPLFAEEPEASDDAASQAAVEKPAELPHRPPTGPQFDIPDPSVPKDLFVKMPPLDIPIIKDGNHQGYLGITVTWQAENKEAAAYIKKMEPVLRNMIITDLYGALYLLWKPGVLLEKSFVIKRLNRSAEKILGKNIIANVFTRDFYVKKKAGR